MTDEAQVVHTVVKETTVWVPYAEGIATALGTFLAGAWPIMVWWNNRQKKKQAEKEAVEEEARKRAPKFLEIGEFKAIMDPFAATNEAAHAEVKKKLVEALEEFGNAHLAVAQMGRDVTDLQKGLAVLESKVESMPDVVVGKMMDKIYHINPPIEKIG